VTPPIVNKNRNPNTNSRGACNLITPPHNVAIQLKILIPVGTAIIIVAAVKYARISIFNPTVYIWCAQTIKPKKPIAHIANTIPEYPKIVFFVKVSII
jgi:cellobiose-specific phosphotransferase system component IIC